MTPNRFQRSALDEPANIVDGVPKRRKMREQPSTQRRLAAEVLVFGQQLLAVENEAKRGMLLSRARQVGRHLGVALMAAA
ncbi:MAG: hypothetical protein ACR2OG_03720 [Gemmatimonadaceae bacterium]